MTKIYIEQENTPELPFSPIFWPNFKFEIPPKRLFLRDIMEQYKVPFFTVVSRKDDADFFAVPYEYFFAEDYARPYLERVFAAALAAGKKVLLFDYADYVDRIPQLPAHAVLFRVSVYRHHLQKNEIVMPYLVEDLGKRYSIKEIEVTGEPSIGYCGQSDFASHSRHLRAVIKWYLSYLFLLLRRDSVPLVHKRGIFWRKRALMLLRASGIPADIIVRTFYSLHRTSGSFDPSMVRKDYVENLRRNVLSLCLRGDANASQRFFETLSASRIPVFIDTDCVLPLEEIINYDKLMLRVPWQRIQALPSILRAFIRGLSASRMQEMERAARVIYDEHLRMDRFFSRVFDREKSPYVDILFPRTP